MSAPLITLTIEEVAAGLKAGEFTSVEITQAYLNRIAELNPKLNVYVNVSTELALAQAKASDERRAAGKSLGVFDGVPYNLKDVYATTDSPTTASSRMLDGWVAPYNATVYHKLKSAGAVLLGKTNTDEFTMGVSTETSWQGVTRNPWDLERVSGGSSGGPAASIAAQLATFSIGTDTGGSVRQPSSFCGVTGMKPTYGRVSRWGELPMASSLDQTGPVTRTAKDAALVFELLAGRDELDATTLDDKVPSVDGMIPPAGDKPLAGMKVGVAEEYFGDGVQPGVEKLIREAIAQVERLGATVTKVSLPAVPHALAAYYIIAPAEVSSNMARYDGIRFGHSVERENSGEKASLYDIYAKSRAEGIGTEVQRRIMLGTHVLSAGHYDAYYRKAEEVRQVVATQFAEAFSEVDVLLAPVSPNTAFKIGEQVNDPVAMYKEDVLAVPANIGGIPGISVPCGFSNGLPVGLQILAGRLNEAALFKTAIAYQAATDFHKQYPEVA